MQAEDTSLLQPCHNALPFLLVRDVISATLPVPDSAGSLDTDVPLDPGLTLWQLSMLVPSETCHRAKTHTLSFIFNSELFIAAKVV